MTGRVAVRRTADTLVIDRAGDAGRISRLAQAAIPVVRRVLPEAHVVVLGSGPYETALRDLVAHLGVEDAVTFRSLPPGERGAMAGELAAASVMAALSSYEAHPVAIMEAVTMGLPVVGFDVAGTGDLVQDGLVRGLPTGATDDEVAAALLTALQEVQAGGPRRHTPVAVVLPTWETSADALAALYDDVLGRTP